jgi:hypothetical protein
MSLSSRQTYSSDDTGGDDQYDASSCDDVWMIAVNQPLDDGRVDQLKHKPLDRRLKSLTYTRICGRDHCHA